MPFVRSVLFLVLCLSVSPCLAFEGLVTLQDGTPAVDAGVTIVGRSGATRTDGQGRFTWQPDPQPPFEVLVVLRGGRTMKPVLVESIPDEGPVSIVLTPIAVEEVTVTADAAPHIQAPPASAMNTMAKEDLEQRRPARLIDAIENVPGAGRLGGSHDSVPSIRGLARGRTLLLIDGMRVTSERRAGPSASFLDPFFLESVEVSRGPGSVAYGSDAFGGVIHATSPSPEPGSPTHMRMTGSYGTGIPELAGGFEISKGLDEGGFLVQARARDFDDYRSPSGDIPNSEASDHGFMGRFDHEVGPGRLWFSARSDLESDVERPADNSDETRVYRPEETSHRLTFAYEMDPLPSALLIEVKGFAGSSRLVTEQEDLTGMSADSRSDIRAKDFGLRALAVKPLTRSRVELGLDLNGRTDLEATGRVGQVEERSIEDADRLDLAAYATAERSLAKSLSASGGLRFDRVTTENDGGLAGDASTSDGAVSGFASLTAGPFRGVSITGQLSRGFRDPSLSDRYFSGISGRGFVNGNPDLDPETSTQADLALRYTSRRIRGGLFTYQYRIEDLIERFEELDPNAAAQDCQPGLDCFFFRNRGEATLHGVELEIEADLGAGVTIEVGAQTARGETEDGSDLDDIPVESLTLQAWKRLGEAGYLQARAALYDRDDRPGPTEIVTPDYGVLDIGGGWNPRPNFELRLLVRNVLDEEYPYSPDRRTVPAPGRSAILSVIATFGG